MSIRELEQITGYDFLYALPDSIEDIIESSASSENGTDGIERNYGRHDSGFWLLLPAREA